MMFLSQFGFQFDKIEEHLNSRRELEAGLSEGAFVSDGIHDDATDTTVIEGEEGAVDFGWVLSRGGGRLRIERTCMDDMTRGTRLTAHASGT